jgi:hypothetical protein
MRVAPSVSATYLYMPFKTYESVGGRVDYELQWIVISSWFTLLVHKDMRVRACMLALDSRAKYYFQLARCTFVLRLVSYYHRRNALCVNQKRLECLSGLVEILDYIYVMIIYCVYMYSLRP